MKNEPYHQTLLQRRQKDTIDEQNPPEFYFASAEDIILIKPDWYRLGGPVSERQWNDTLGVLRIQKESLDLTCLKNWATKLQIIDLLQQAFEQVSIG